MANKININQNQLYSAAGALDPRFIVDSVDKITSISNAYVGLEVSVVDSEENTVEKYRIKKINNLTNKPLPASQGGYELIQEPRDLKYSDGTSSFLDNSGNINPDPTIDGKIDKVSDANGNLPKFDSNGNLVNSNILASSVLTSHQDISGKADKASSYTDGNLAKLNSEGNLADSGISASDCVRVDEIQNLTEEKKQRARSNINALNINDLKTINGESLYGSGNITIRSAYEEWLNEGNTGTEQEFLASLKAQFGSFVPALYCTDTGHEGEPGDSNGNLITPDATTLNYIYLVDNDDTTPTAKTMWITVVVDDSDPEDIEYGWTSIGDVQVDLTFGSGQALNDVKIKDASGQEVSGIADVLSAEAGKEIGETLYTPTTSVKSYIKLGKYYKKSDGTLGDDSSRGYTTKVAVQEGEKYRIQTVVADTQAVAFLPTWNGDTYNGDAFPSDLLPDSGNIAVTIDYTIPANVTHIAASIQNKNQGQPIIEKIINKCNFTPKSDVLELIPKYNSFIEISSLNTGKYLNRGNGGKLSDSGGSNVTDYILVNPANTYNIKTYLSKANDAGVAYYASTSEDSFICFDKNFVDYDSSAGTTVSVEHLLNVPQEANYIRVGIRNNSEQEYPIISVVEYIEAASKAELNAIAAEVENKVEKEQGKGLSKNDFTDNYKEILDDWQDNVFPPNVVEHAVEDYIEDNDAGIITKTNGLSVLDTYTVKVGSDVAEGNITIENNEGWSESSGVYTHTSGNTKRINIDLSNAEFSTNDRIIVTFDTSNLSESVECYMCYGNLPKIKSYNGGDSHILGFIYNSSYNMLSFEPTSNFTGTISNILVRKVVNSEGSPIQMTENNVYCLRNSLVAGFWNVFIGKKGPDGSGVTGGAVQYGTRNVAIGYGSLSGLLAGNRNVGVGTFSLPYVTEGENNVAIGADTIYPARKANDCIGIGKGVLTGGPVTSCIGIGVGALAGSFNATTERKNCVAIGQRAGAFVTTNCVCMGHESGRNTEGNNCVAIGYRALTMTRASDGYIYTSHADGDNNTCIGYNAAIEYNSSALEESYQHSSNSTAIGANAKITKSNQVVIGDSNVSEIKIGGGSVVLILGDKKLVLNDDNDHTITWEALS